MLETIVRETGPSPTVAVIWLHGLGADGNDFADVVDMFQLPPQPAVRFIFPHAPMRSITINGGMVMRGWYDLTGMELVLREDREGIQDSSNHINKLIEDQVGQGIPASRIILGGFSQGGAMALHVGLRSPDKLAGIVALSTYLLLADGVSSEASEANSDTPVFAAHGLFDPVVMPSLGESMRQTLEDLGYPLEWHTYPIPHSVSAEEIADLSKWLSQVISSMP